MRARPHRRWLRLGLRRAERAFAMLVVYHLAFDLSVVVAPLGAVRLVNP